MAIVCGLARCSAGIEHQRGADFLFSRHMRVAVADKLVQAVGDRLVQQLLIVAVQQRNFHAREFQRGEAAVKRLAGLLDRRLQSHIVIDVAQHEMRGPGGEQRDDCRRTDIAAVQHPFHAETFEHSHAAAGVFHMAVSIANNA